MQTRPLAIFAFALAGIPAWAQTVQPSVPASGEIGFFRPASDPALRSIPAAPAPPAARRGDDPGQPVDMAVEIRKVEEARNTEAQMDRSEQDHERARAEAVTATAPTVAVGTPASTLPAGVPNALTR